jgi:threonine aldolase
MTEIIDLRSDTVTQPTAQMRRAMYEAEVGDDYYHEDKTTKALEERSAAIMGKDAALLVGSGSVGNIISIVVQTKPGDAIAIGSTSHIYLNEVGNIGAIAGVLPRLVPERSGRIEPDALEGALQSDDMVHARATLVAVENTHNASGGFCTDAQATAALAARARKLKLRLHCDGARIFNAAIALNVTPDRLAAPFDSLTFCLTKGLACPFGSIIVGDSAFIAEARRWRQRLSGSFRQIGIMAAAGLIGLDTMVDRLAEDHANAKALAAGLADLGLTVNATAVETNIVFAEIPATFGDAGAFVAQMRAKGVVVNSPNRRRVRFVTHWGIDAAAIDKAVRLIAQIAKSLPGLSCRVS